MSADIKPVGSDMQIIQFVSLSLFLPRARIHVHGHTGTDTHLYSPLSGLNHVEFPFTVRRITNRAELRNTCCLMELHMKECDGVREGEREKDIPVCVDQRCVLF